MLTRTILDPINKPKTKKKERLNTKKRKKNKQPTCRKIKAENLMKEEENFKGDAALGR